MSRIQLMLCSELPADQLESFNGGHWVASIKEDGRRLAIIKTKNEIRLLGRDGPVDNEQYPEIVEAVSQIGGEFTLDGEACVISNGRSDFELLQSRDKIKDPLKRKILVKRYPATYVAFDLPECPGNLLERYTELKRLLPLDSDTIKVSPIDYDIQKVWEKANKEGHEGIILKNSYSKYEHARSTNWIKVKIKFQEVVKATSYQINNKGIRCELEEGLAVQVAGFHAPPVKEAIDLKGSALIRVEGLGTGRTKEGAIRQIVFVRLESTP